MVPRDGGQGVMDGSEWEVWFGEEKTKNDIDVRFVVGKCCN